MNSINDFRSYVLWMKSIDVEFILRLLNFSMERCHSFINIISSGVIKHIGRYLFDNLGYYLINVTHTFTSGVNGAH